MSAGKAIRLTDDGLLVFVRVTPKAAKDIVGGSDVASDGRTRLRVRVRAIPDKGAANVAVLKILAKALGCPKSTLSIESGTTDRNKSVLVRGAGKEIAARLALLLENPP